MKRVLFLILFSMSVSLYGQVVTYAKTLPERAWSIGVSPAWHMDRNVILFDAGEPPLH